MTLPDYMREVIGNGPAIPVSVFNGVTFVGDFAQIVIDRRGEFQTQLCLCKPNAEIPDHGHPGVESVLFYITGEIYFRIEHEGGMVDIWKRSEIQATTDGQCTHNGKFIILAAGQKHGATIGKSGGAFMTFQRWFNGNPQSVERDWDGPVLSDEHAKELANHG